MNCCTDTSLILSGLDSFSDLIVNEKSNGKNRHGLDAFLLLTCPDPPEDRTLLYSWCFR